MQFELPTTKSKMYSILNDIFYYYRIKKDDLLGANLTPLTLDRQTFTKLTETQLKSKAQKLLAPSQTLRTLTRRAQIQADLNKCQSELNSTEYARRSAEEKLILAYEKVMAKAEKEATKKGLLNSDVIVNKLAELEAEREQKVIDLNAEYNEKKSAITSRIFQLNSDLEDADTFYSDVNGKEVDAKAVELSEKQDEIEREVFKYNNSLSEKEQHSVNSINEKRVRLSLQYEEIRTLEYSRDQLIEMGYYTDVIDCICAYYDLLDESIAYQDIVNENKLTIYLDDYYPTIVYMYQVRAGR